MKYPPEYDTITAAVVKKRLFYKKAQNFIRGKCGTMTGKIKPLYLQIVFTLLVFAVLIFFNYLFNSKTVRENLSRNADSVLSFTHDQINFELAAYRILLESFTQTVQQMISDESIDRLQNYINTLTDYVISEKSGLKCINGLYGYFEKSPEGAVFLNGIGWIPPDDFDPKERLWYKNAKTNCGKITETEPHLNDNIADGFFITYSYCIHDEKGGHVGVVGIDVPLNTIGGIAVSAELNDGGYGILVSADYTIIAHANPFYVGRKVNELDIEISKFIPDFVQGRNLYERKVKNWKGEYAIVFSRKMPNGWHILLLSPKDRYYQGTTKMLIFSCILGATMAAALIIVLIRIDRAKEKADEDSRQKSAFLTNMSHEIRTPMNAIIGMTYIGKTADNISRKDYCLEKIENASQHLLGVINDVLDMSKIEANMFELSQVEFNFEKMLQRVISIVGFRAEEKKQKISVHVDKSIPRILTGDDQRLAQVITNLLGNAVKFTPEEGSIKLETVFKGEENGICEIQVTVKDSGIGISEENQKKLFRSFQQADSKTSRKFGGSGLGLVISKNIVEMMGGRIKIQSEPGKGSSFSFTFRAKYTADAPQRHSSSISKNEEDNDYSGIFEGYKILLAEDVEINREIIDTLIEPSLLKMDCAENGLEAVEMFAKSPEEYDLIFMDVQMPEMDGYEATRKIRAIEAKWRKKQNESGRTIRPQPVTIVAMTANVFKEDIENCLAAGMNDHIGKPIDVQDFFNKIRKYLLKKA